MSRALFVGWLGLISAEKQIAGEVIMTIKINLEKRDRLLCIH
jgi:hypothetical protein